MVKNQIEDLKNVNLDFLKVNAISYVEKEMTNIKSLKQEETARFWNYTE